MTQSHYVLIFIIAFMAVMLSTLIREISSGGLKSAHFFDYILQAIGASAIIAFSTFIIVP